MITTLFAEVVHAKKVTINNLKPRLDSKGNIIDVHDGSIQRFQPNEYYYAHAAQYGLCKEPLRYGCDQVGKFLSCIVLRSLIDP